MKIISWNCNGAFRKKFHALLEFNADIYVIQECENPAESKDIEYKSWRKIIYGLGILKTKDLLFSLVKK